MKKLLATLLFGLSLFGLSVNAEEVSLTYQGITLTLFDTTCEVKQVIDVTAPHLIEKLRGGRATFVDHPERQFCWLTDGKLVYILDEALEGPDPIPVTAFKPSEQVKEKARKTI